MSGPNTRLIECPECEGEGEVDDGPLKMTCSECDGTGEIEVEN